MDHIPKYERYYFAKTDFFLNLNKRFCLSIGLIIDYNHKFS